jgi:alpha-beta hydrolase superfamily lysophospholipase
MLPTLVLAGGLGLVPKPPSPSPAAAVTFTTSDGVTVYADSYAGPSPKAPVILLFHQAESSRNEYAPIAPRLVELGYNVLAVDQRSGGDLYPPANETVQHLGRSADYIDVLPDMNGALAWAQRTYPGAPVIAWGSSYSAALVFAFAASHPRDLAAVLAFSPRRVSARQGLREPRGPARPGPGFHRFGQRPKRRERGARNLSCRALAPKSRLRSEGRRPRFVDTARRS